MKILKYREKKKIDDASIQLVVFNTNCIFFFGNILGISLLRSPFLLALALILTMTAAILFGFVRSFVWCVAGLPARPPFTSHGTFPPRNQHINRKER